MLLSYKVSETDQVSFRALSTSKKRFSHPEVSVELEHKPCFHPQHQYNSGERVVRTKHLKMIFPIKQHNVLSV